MVTGEYLGTTAQVRRDSLPLRCALSLLSMLCSGLRIVALELVLHPDQPPPTTTCMDYDMPDGVLRLRLLAALAG